MRWDSFVCPSLENTNCHKLRLDQLHQIITEKQNREEKDQDEQTQLTHEGRKKIQGTQI